MSVELERYRALGWDTAAALTETALALTPKMTEYRAAAHLSGRLLERRIEPILLLIAGADRLPLYRHPLLTATNLGARAMLVAVACRNGLIASLTRNVAIAPLPPAERNRMVRLLAVESAFLSSTKPGRRLGDVFADGVAAYAKHGFEADEWHLHHQGGPTGYFGRDEFVTHLSDRQIAEAQAFAWSASVPGLKVEDTVVTTNASLEILTRDDVWPTMDVAGRARPMVLER
jgi:Xaa-Pro aminopeptidase